MRYEVDVVTGDVTEHEDFPPVVLAPQPYSLMKTTLWKRLSDKEADIVFAAKKDQPAKFQGMWDDAGIIDTSDEDFFPRLKEFLQKTIGEKRAKEILSPEQ